jgi:hypothetical protein
MPKKYTEALISKHLQTLSETPQRIATATAGLDEARLKTPHAAGEWSAVQNMAHLRACAECWSATIYAMLTLDDPVLAYIHPRDWVKRLGFDRMPFVEHFHAFEAERVTLLRVLRGLKFEQFDLSAGFIGRANRFSIFDQTQRMAEHEAQHCDQIEVIFSGG